MELCRDLREGGTAKSSADVEDSEVVVHMESAKILVISHDISLINQSIDLRFVSGLRTDRTDSRPDSLSLADWFCFSFFHKYRFSSRLSKVD